MHGYSQDLRDRAIALYKTGTYSKKDLAQLLSLGYATIRRWCDRYNETGNCLIIKPVNEGRRRIFTDKQAVLDYLQAHPDADGIELRNKLAPHVSQSCFYNTLRRMDITYKKRGKL
jgi:transposase